MQGPHLSIVIPAYNEEQRLPRALDGVAQYYASQGYAFDVAIVSDGSSDGTDAIVRDFAASHAEFRLISYQPNRGKGYAVRTGMLAAEGELVLFCDADLATPPEETEKLLASIEGGADVAIGSRPLKGSALEVRQPWYREAFGRTANKLIQLLGVPGVKDTQCGFKLFRRAVAHDIFKRCRVDGFSFDVEALMIARDLGYRIDEVPIRWADQAGSKVVLWRDAPKALFNLVRLRLKGKKRRIEVRER